MLCTSRAGDIGVAARLDEALGPMILNGNTPLDQNDPFIRAVPVRRKYVASGIAREEFNCTALWVLAERRAFGVLGALPFHLSGIGQYAAWHT